MLKIKTSHFTRLQRISDSISTLKKKLRIFFFSDIYSNIYIRIYIRLYQMRNQTKDSLGIEDVEG